MRIVILGCNGGTDISFGGGAYVVAAMAHSLELKGHEVYLLSVLGLDRARLTKLHGWPLNSNVKVSCLFDAARGLRIPHIVALRMVGSFADLIASIKPDVVICHDDIPAALNRTFRKIGAFVVVYVHLSYRTRLAYPRLLFSATEWSTPETFVNAIGLRMTLSSLGEADAILANSKATAAVTRAVAGNVSIQVLNPPLLPSYRTTQSTQKTRAICLHAARQDRSFLGTELLEFIIESGKSCPDRVIVVNRNKSRPIAAASHKGPNVKAFTSLPAPLWRTLLQKTKYYLHFRWFEGFGISTAEAVANGAVPIVYRSPFNGSATDVVNPFVAQCSFKAVREAVSILEGFENDSRKYDEISYALKEKLIRDLDFDLFSDGVNLAVGGRR